MDKSCRNCIHRHGALCFASGRSCQFTAQTNLCGTGGAWAYWAKRKTFLDCLYEHLTPAVPPASAYIKVKGPDAPQQWIVKTEETPQEPLVIDIKILHRMAGIPEHKTPGSAGVDLQAIIETPITLNPGDRQQIKTGIAIHIKYPNIVGYVFPRSGLGARGLVLANSVGVLDSDYTGEILLNLVNMGTDPLTIEPGDRVAQLVFTACSQVRFQQKDVLSETRRGSGGYGSTGVK